MKDLTGEFSQVLISSPSKEEANLFSDTLVKEKLVAGALILDGSSRYWWNGEIIEKTYWNVQAFTQSKNKDFIIRRIEEIASDDCPIIAFLPLDGNQKFLDWICKSMV